MSDPERWAKTQDQIDRLHAARSRGGLCARCGRALDADDVVYFERFAVGTTQSRLHGPVRPRWIVRAPVGVECASPELLRQVEGHDPERCDGCGRGVFHPRPRASRQFASCSRWCVGRRGFTKQRTPAGEEVPNILATSSPARVRRGVAPSEHWGVRLKRCREARGFSRNDLAAALVARFGFRTKRDQVIAWEERQAGARVETFGALAQMLGVSMETLLHGEEEAARIAEERERSG